MPKTKLKLFGRKFQNWLLFLVVSRQDLKSILGYTLQALLNDGDLWQKKIDIIQPLYDDFDAGLTGKAGALAGQGQQTLLAETAYRLVKQFMKNAYKVNFASLEVKAPDVFKLFFPQGRTQFSSASRRELGTIFGTFVETLTANKGKVPEGAALLADANALLEGFKTARQTQDKRKKQVKTAGTDLVKDETDVLVELFGVYAALLAHYYKTPERVADYFDFSVLPPSYHKSDADDAETPSESQPV
ncbi:hypothetical protein Q5H93_20465 [Hymenobacter sp. ASUV-10]|uniref:Uncharacterized protein n=1 Tax=Hymenobacter aranciens TaxID=3063996 RepID=A0ABT9BFT4_9BACT|nr:hypothetical protein [Hymenobacter sp. ASUV-10]MDO7877131.1 hypothetical protein [Hymenobacter sp. ASUV-10]